MKTDTNDLTETVQTYAIENILLNKASENKIKRFKQVEARSFVAIQCPLCESEFGIDVDKIDTFGLVNYHYSCPYCHAKLGLKD